MAIYISESIAGDSSTGSYWNVVQDPQIFSNNAHTVPFGVFLESAANQTKITGGLITGATRGVSLYPGSSPYYSPNNVIIDNVDFTSCTYGVYYSGVAGNSNTRVLGLKIHNNRFEQCVTACTAFVNCDQVSENPPEFSGNFYLGTATAISNPNNIRVYSTDLPQTLAGTVAFSGGTTAAVSFSIAQPSSNYIVSIEVPDNKTYWITGKSAAGFTVNASAATSATVGWRVTRL